MNPMTNVKNVLKYNRLELERGIKGTDPSSWHHQYKDSAWIFIGGLNYDLTEGDIVCVFSQYGEIVNVNLIRDKKTGKSKGFGFLCYENQKSTILAVDNLNGIKITGRTIRVDHVEEYKVPKDAGHEDELTVKMRDEGIHPTAMRSYEDEDEDEDEDEETEKSKKKKKKEKKQKRRKSSSSIEGVEFKREPALDVKPEVNRENCSKEGVRSRKGDRWEDRRQNGVHVKEEPPSPAPYPHGSMSPSGKSAFTQRCIGNKIDRPASPSRPSGFRPRSPRPRSPRPRSPRQRSQSPRKRSWSSKPRSPRQRSPISPRR